MKNEEYSVKWLAISLGSYQTCGIILSSNSLKCFGKLDTFSSSYLNINLAAQQIKTMVTHSTHTCINSTSNKLYCFGDNTFEQLSIPEQYKHKVESVAVGMRDTCIVTNGGENVDCFGIFDTNVRVWQDDQGFKFHHYRGGDYNRD